MKRPLLPILFLIPFLAAPLLASVGVVSAVRGDAFIQRNSTTIKASVGTPLERHDTVRTGKEARLQIIFRDKSVVTLGHDSTLRIDAYLYEGADSRVDLSMTRGFFRSVTGKIGKIAPQKFKLHTANATIGIRGTEILIDADPKKGDTIACALGRIVVTALASGKSVEVDAGHSVTVNPRGALSAPKTLDKTQMQSMMQGQDDAREAAAAIRGYRSNAYDERTQSIVEKEAEESVDGTGQVPSTTPDTGTPSDATAQGENVNVYDYDYVSLGFTRDNEGKTTNSWITTKDQTPEQTITEYRINQVTADYTGGIVAMTDGKPAEGTVSMHFDFGQSTFNGTLDFQAENGPRWIVEMQGSGSSELKSDGSFTTQNVNSADNSEVTIQNGKIDGKFYGPNAENIGGSFGLNGDNGHTARGYFGGTR